MDQHQVAFVAEQRIGGAGRLLDLRQRRRRLGDDPSLPNAPERAPGRPADAEHLVQHARAFDGERRGRQSGGPRGWFDHVVVPHFSRLVQGRVSGSSQWSGLMRNA